MNDRSDDLPHFNDYHIENFVLIFHPSVVREANLRVGLDFLSNFII